MVYTTQMAVTSFIGQTMINHHNLGDTLFSEQAKSFFCLGRILKIGVPFATIDFPVKNLGWFWGAILWHPKIRVY